MHDMWPYESIWSSSGKLLFYFLPVKNGVKAIPITTCICDQILIFSSWFGLIMRQFREVCTSCKSLEMWCESSVKQLVMWSSGDSNTHVKHVVKATWSWLQHNMEPWYPLVRYKKWDTLCQRVVHVKFHFYIFCLIVLIGSFEPSQAIVTACVVIYRLICVGVGIRSIIQYSYRGKNAKKYYHYIQPLRSFMIILTQL